MAIKRAANFGSLNTSNAGDLKGISYGDSMTQFSSFFGNFSRISNRVFGSIWTICTIICLTVSLTSICQVGADVAEGNVYTNLNTKLTAAGTPEKKINYIFRFPKFPNIAVMRCTPNDLEEMRQLLLITPEYPVKYTLRNMRVFASWERFYEFCFLAKDIELETPKIVGLVAAYHVVEDSQLSVTMVAVDKEYRRKGIAKTIMVHLFEEASQPKYNKIIKEATLHVWVAQPPPFSLYFNIGFAPQSYLPNYYYSQSVPGGYEMTMPLPYKKIEEHYRIKVAEQELQFNQLLSHVTSVYKPDAQSTLSKLRMESVKSVKDELIVFFRSILREKVRKGTLETVLGCRHAYAALWNNGDVAGVIWISEPFILGDQINKINLLVNPSDKGLVFLSLWAHLFQMLNNVEGLYSVRYVAPCEQTQELIYYWQLGLRPRNFNESSKDKKHTYDLFVDLPWQPSEELQYVFKSRLLDINIEELTNMETLGKNLTLQPISTPRTANTPKEPQLSSITPKEPQLSNFAPKEAQLASNTAKEPQLGDNASEEKVNDNTEYWYNRVWGVFLVCSVCSVLMYFCYRSCAEKTPNNPVATSIELMAAATIGSSAKSIKSETNSETVRRPSNKVMQYSKLDTPV